MKTKNIVYKTMSECSLAQQVTVEVLMALKRRATDNKVETAAGFKKNGNINWTQLKPYMDVHINDLDLEDIDDDKYLKFRGIRMEATAGIAQIQLEKEKGSILDRAYVEDMIKSIAVSQKTLLKNKLTSELPPQLLGLGVTEMTVILDRVVNEVCELMQNMKV